MPKQKDHGPKTNNTKHNNNSASNGNLNSNTNTKPMMANGNHNTVAANNTTSNSMAAKKQNARDKEKVQREREKIVLWRRPIQTLKYCTLECCALLQYYGIK